VSIRLLKSTGQGHSTIHAHYISPLVNKTPETDTHQSSTAGSSIMGDEVAHRARLLTSAEVATSGSKNLRKEGGGPSRSLFSLSPPLPLEVGPLKPASGSGGAL